MYNWVPAPAMSDQSTERWIWQKPGFGGDTHPSKNAALFSQEAPHPSLLLISLNDASTLEFSTTSHTISFISSIYIGTEELYVWVCLSVKVCCCRLAVRPSLMAAVFWIFKNEPDGGILRHVNRGFIFISFTAFHLYCHGGGVCLGTFVCRTLLLSSSSAVTSSFPIPDRGSVLNFQNRAPC